MNSGKLGESEGARRRMEMGCGGREVVSLSRWGRGFMIGEGMEWVRVGDKFVGGSYLCKKKKNDKSLYYKSKEKTRNESSSPNTHNKNPKPDNRNSNPLEYIRKPQHSSSITSRALRKDDDRYIRRASDVFQASTTTTRRRYGLMIWGNVARRAEHG